MPEILTCEQGSPEWFEARMGIPTSSEFHTVLAKPRKGYDESRTRRTYLLKLAGEILTGQPMENYTNDHMERGKIMEDEARSYYAFKTDYDLERVGFIRNGNTGCSPDSLIGGDGMLEVKTKLAHLAIDCILKDQFPPEHKAQCQGALWVAEREWVDIVVYWPGLPTFIKRDYRDEAYIKDLASEVDRFNAELATIVDRVRRYGQPSTLKADLRASLEATA